MKYLPQGNHYSFALPRCNGYGQWSEEYFKRSNQETFIDIMIEHIDAIANLNEIFSGKDFDAVFVGPYDLSGSMGIPRQFDNPLFKSTLALIYKMQLNTYWQLFPLLPENVQHLRIPIEIRLGHNFC